MNTRRELLATALFALVVTAGLGPALAQNQTSPQYARPRPGPFAGRWHFKAQKEGMNAPYLDTSAVDNLLDDGSYVTITPNGGTYDIQMDDGGTAYDVKFNDTELGFTIVLPPSDAGPYPMRIVHKYYFRLVDPEDFEGQYSTVITANNGMPPIQMWGSVTGMHVTAQRGSNGMPSMPGIE